MAKAWHAGDLIESTVATAKRTGDRLGPPVDMARYDPRAMANATNKHHHKVTTPPKGRPTPNRGGRRYSGRVFSSTFQWVATAATFVVVMVIVYLVFFG